MNPAINFFLVVGLWEFLRYSKRRRKEYEVSRLFIYPIKSCQGIEVEQAEIARTGFKYDRVFVLVDDQNNFISQRKYPEMALIRTCINSRKSTLEISHPDYKTIEVSLEDLSESSKNVETVFVWKQPCEAVEAGGEDIHAWFNIYLGTKGVRLMRMKQSFVRKTDPEYAPKGQTAFADGFPFLLASEESLNRLNETLPFSITMDRFRPNIVVKNCAPYEEDHWRQVVFKAGQIIVNVVKPCSRCTIPDVDPVIGVMDENHTVSKELMNIRAGEHLGFDNPKWKKKVYMLLFPRCQ